MNEKLVLKNPELKKENEVGIVVRGFFGGDYDKFQKNVRVSFEKKEFVVGTGAFLRSVIGQVKMNQDDFALCQKAIRMEISKIKKEYRNKEKKEKTAKEEMARCKEIEQTDVKMANEIRARIREGALEKETEERAYCEKHGLEYPSDSLE